MGSAGGRAGGIEVVDPHRGAIWSPKGPLVLGLGCPFLDGEAAQVFPFGFWGVQIGRLLFVLSQKSRRT